MKGEFSILGAITKAFWFFRGSGCPFSYVCISAPAHHRRNPPPFFNWFVVTYRCPISETSLCQCSTITSVLRFIFWMLQVSMCPWYSVLHKSSLIAARGIFFTARPHCSALDPWHCQLRQSHTGLWFDKITKSRDWNQGVFLVGLLSKI